MPITSRFSVNFLLPEWNIVTLLYGQIKTSSFRASRARDSSDQRAGGKNGLQRKQSERSSEMYLHVGALPFRSL